MSRRRRTCWAFNHQDTKIVSFFDDLEYLNDSKYFHENKGKLFEIEAIDEEIFFDADTRNYKKKLKIDKNIIYEMGPSL